METMMVKAYVSIAPPFSAWQQHGIIKDISFTGAYT